jgi:hypothetical protein
VADNATGTFHLTEDDLVAAGRLYSRIRLGRPRTIVAFLCLWFFSLMLFTFLVTGRSSPAAISENPGLIFALSILPFVLVFSWTAWIIPVMARRNFRQQRSLQGEFGYAWTGETLTVKTEYASFDMPWSHFLRWIEDDKTFLLFESDRLYRVIPKRALTADQQQSLRHHLAGIGV